MKTAFVVDATGHSRTLVRFDETFDPGYQGAYGLLMKVKNHPFALNQMFFMDWTSDHCENRPMMKAR